MMQRLLSYLIPITVFKKKSLRSKTIEINWNNGEMVLDTLNTNYSYGSLQRILRYGLQNIGFHKIAKMEAILVLGVAGGSVIKTLIDEIKFKGKITGIEIDSEMNAIANQYFKLDSYKNVEIIIEDAFEYVLKNNHFFDLIIIDVFEDIKMPNFLFERFFSQRVCQMLKNKGFILFNTMLLNTSHTQRNQKYMSEIDSISFSVKALPRVEEHNELILIQKK
ncbi:spermidine synthase [Flavobacterium agrisoli]|uniref:Fused MFS/spermidine synthase n=1 Tax=Flavobacterium agrisoli TaxID=2793066 RepID=A0A934PKB0_9FLAO|nr:fused MFS/spermidine synthase [Flavobacterium agrisoli]MBK0368498.1 fused MFS/spermidine synthase [Flavobacterium agrisoli]